ncbi:MULTISPECIES: D-alanyl-D-alanine carboxypeptidase [Streptomyces]|uniref:D-alanyl-D-alanine carboxypeptidase n=1 Tax=Streptomyces glycanivorans TaxID=3033808 RepID=A0ABY9JDK6_9ACTN|nr:D-alanyl-D-alanine carboxypeptidase [Streptomyces sp. Alt3]WLQ65857.1 D-alanyl-D-alanine carboxypeptidase [Streptomyces sp. Alt3]
MAGESPGKSDQRKSSGTAEERDPRFAVFREPVAEADGHTAVGKAAEGSADAGTDSATAVFRLPPSAKAEASEDASASAKGAEGPGGASTPQEGASAPSEADDATGGAPEAPGAPAGAAGPGEAAKPEPVADSGAGAGAGPEAEAEAEVDAVPEGDEEQGAGAADSERAADSGRASDSDPVGDSGREEAAEAASGAEPEAGSDTAPKPTDARLRAAVAAWVATGPDEEAAAQDGDPEDADKAPEADADPSGADGKAADGDGAAVTDEKATSDGGATKAAADVTTPDTDAPTDADAAADDKPSAGAASKGSAEAEAEAEADKAPAAATAAPAPVGGPRVPKTREEATPAKEPESASDGRGIDHPTAVFKAPRAEQLDQPTTALKLPAKAKAQAKEPAKTEEPAPEKEAERKPSWASKVAGTTEAPETPAERTSKFVPLRSDDVRPAAVVGPTVTPDVAARPGTPGAPGAGLVEAERTRQQPMPPRPPLDLLAELTNTPPPPETPVRTAVRRVKIWTPLVLLLLVIFAIAQAVRPLPDPVLTLSADPTYTFGGEKLDMPWPEEGQGAVEVEGVGTIGTYGKEKSAPVASVAKIMTAYVILQGHPITGKEKGEQIEVDAKAGEEADRPDESTAPIKEGQKYTERQMLQLLMIPSGNNVARLLARWDATTEKAFVEKMNAAAKDLGMTNSVYTDPSGLESTTRSTPADQLKLAKAVMQNDVFREIVNMPQAEIPGIGKMIYNNNNILLEPGVSGIKTGSSTPAGGNLVWTAETIIDGKSRRIIGAVMGADVDGTLDAKLQRALQSSLALIQTAQDGVDSATVVKKGQVVGYVDNGFGTRTPVVATKDLKAVGWGGLEVDLKLTDGGKTPAHVAEAGTVVGEVTVGTGTGKVSAPVALRSAMTEPGFGDKLTRIG